MSSDKKLVVFGCSHTHWRLKPTWAEILEVNGVDILNYGNAGKGNDYLKSRLIDFLRNNDTEHREVIFQLTYSPRILEIWDKLHLTTRYSNFVQMLRFTKNASREMCEFFDKFLFLDDDIINDRFLETQYQIYSLLKLHNKTYHVMNINNQDLIPEFEPHYIDTYIQYNDNSQYNIKFRYDGVEYFDNHMDIDQQLAVTETVIEKLNLPPINTKTKQYLEQAHRYLSSKSVESQDETITRKYMIELFEYYTQEKPNVT